MSMDLLAAGVVCKKKYEETELCGSAADFLLGVAINASKSDEIEISNKEGAGGEEGEKGGGGDFFGSMSDDNGNTSPCASNSSTHGSPPPDVALPSQLTNGLPPDVVTPTKMPATLVCKPTRARPRTSNKFGQGKHRGGDRKFTLHRAINITPPPPEAADVYGAGDLPATNSKSKKKLSKATILRCLKTSKRKRLSAKDQITVANKKLHMTPNQCKTLAALAQNRRRESNLACHQAKRLVDGMQDKMTTILHEAARDVAAAKLEADDIVNKSTEALSKVIVAERGYHHAKALATHKKHAKQLSLQQRDFDVVIKDMKRTSQRKAMSAKKDFDVVVKDMKRTSQRKAMSAKKDFNVLIQDIRRTSKCIAKSADVVLEQQAATKKTLRSRWHWRNCPLSSCAINWKMSTRRPRQI